MGVIMSPNQTITAGIRPIISCRSVTTVSTYDRVAASLLTLFWLASLLLSSLVVIWCCSYPGVPRGNPIPRPPVFEGLAGAWPLDSSVSSHAVKSPEIDSVELTSDNFLQELADLDMMAMTLLPVSSDLEHFPVLAESRISGVCKTSVADVQGIGGQPLGADQVERSVLPRERRWFIEFSDATDLAEYAMQLDFFGIEPGAVFTDDHRLVYISDVSRDKPAVRLATSGREEDRLYMTWTAGYGRKTDQELFDKAGVDVTFATIVHFYPKQLEEQLVELELAFAGRTENEIRRTLFQVRRIADKYEFRVRDQLLR